MRPDDPQDLESALAAYRRLPRAEPSAALDAAIQARARAGVATRARPRWPVLFATAATLVLAASLGWRTWRDGSEQPAPLAPPESAQEAAMPAKAATVAKPAANDSAETAPLQDSRARAEEAAQAAPAPPLRETDEQRGDRAPGVVEPSPPSVPQAFSGSAADAAHDAVVAPAPLPASPAPPAPAAPMPRPEVQAAPPAIDAQSSLGLMKKAEAPPSEAEAEADALQATTGAEAAQRANAVPDVAEPAGVGAPPAAPAATGAGRDLPRRQASASNEAAAALEPIRELLREGRRAEARQALARWRQEWPDAVVPEDLRTLLQ